MTNDLQNLSLYTPYDGLDELHLIDGSCLHITRVGAQDLSFLLKSCSLNNVLCVPSSKENLDFVSKFYLTNNMSIEFFCDYFLVKDLFTGKIIIRAKSKTLFSLSSLSKNCSTSSSSCLVAYFNVRISSLSWHQRLGHPALKISHYVLSKLKNINCNSCHCNKSHRLTFRTSPLQSSRPLELLYSDSWGLFSCIFSTF